MLTKALSPTAEIVERPNSELAQDYELDGLVNRKLTDDANDDRNKDEPDNDQEPEEEERGLPYGYQNEHFEEDDDFSDEEEAPALEVEKNVWNEDLEKEDRLFGPKILTLMPKGILTLPLNLHDFTLLMAVRLNQNF